MAGLLRQHSTSHTILARAVARLVSTA